MEESGHTGTGDNISFFLSTVLVITVVYLIPRLWIASYNPYLVGIDGYYHLRISEEIKRSGYLVSYDSLSYGGRPHMYPPGFHILAVIVSLMGNIKLEVFLRSCAIFYGWFVILSVFSGLVKYSRYHIYSGEERSFSSNKRDSYVIILILFFLSWTPSFIWPTSITALPNSISYFFFFFILFNIRNTLLSTVSILAYSHIHTTVYLLIPGLILFSRDMRRAIFYILLIFITTATLWFPAVKEHGISVIRQNVPVQLYHVVFEPVTKYNISYMLSFPLLLFSILSWDYMKYYKRFMYLITIFSVMIITETLEYGRGIGFINICLGIISFYGVKKISQTFIEKMAILIMVIVVILLAHRWGPGIRWAFFSEQDRIALASLSLLPQGVTLSTDVEGHWITALGHKKSFIDGHFIGIDDAQKRYSDMAFMYVTKNTTSLARLLGLYNISYIFYSRWAHLKFDNYINETSLEVHPCLYPIYYFNITKEDYEFTPSTVRPYNITYDIFVYSTEKCRSLYR